jgi:thiamine transporter
MRDQRTQTLVEAALCVALSVALNFLAMRLPIHVAGGSVSLTMLPIAVLAIRRGILPGAGAGALFGLLDLLIEPYILVPAQVALDYPLPYLLLGLGVGAFSNAYLKTSGDKAAGPAPAGGGLVAGSLALAAALPTGGALRLACHILSGVLFFAEYAGDQNVWVYSLVYNVTYIGPSLVACLLCALALMPVLNKAVPVHRP